ncbi:vWA domain-containing protein [Roseimaritima sediminicola]|uniref:vWA domain-containing protein n=1 Tax=Roseimaritima sediminicola TaxID=2662066 RepID=UPI0012984208|nr:vWA domain-containing protein [Roseimaritima sediminicola]
MNVLPDDDGDDPIQTGFTDLLFSMSGILILVIFVLALLNRASDMATAALKAQRDYAVSQRIKNAGDTAVMVSELERINREQQVVISRSEQELKKTHDTLDETHRKAEQYQAEAEETARKVAKVETERDAAQRKSESLNAILAESETQREALEGEIESYKSAKSVVIVAVVDCSKSMDELSDLKAAISALVDSMPKALERFQIGIVAYRGGKQAVLPVLTVRPYAVDYGASADRVQKFVNSLQAVGGNANVDQALESGMGMLARAGESKRQVLFLLGDQSCQEMEHHTPQTDAAVVGRVRAWANASGTDRRTLAIFTGDGTNPRAHDFFKQIGDVNLPSEFSVNSADMFRSVFNAAFWET